MALFDNFDTITPANMPAGPKQGDWTYSAYCQIPDDGNRYEIIAGVLYMAPSPSGGHQKTANLISYYLTTYIYFAGLGEVYIAPFDVELEKKTVVQPDVCVLLQENIQKYVSSRIIGAPDLVVEVASPSTTFYDRRQKYLAYERAGVKEYWLVEPRQESIEVVFLEEGRYQSQGMFRGQEKLPTRLVEHFPVEARQCFA
ncbi:MAG TPA: Uma2 family endonuclease [Ktedonobacteraceae bacterium]|jgi:Uma2 family endonuclease|nr:Uma2 family endonuclease [Ktedonobacteraceae bacterium]